MKPRTARPHIRQAGENPTDIRSPCRRSTGKKRRKIMADQTTDSSAVPVAEVARALGTTPLNVLLYIKRGLLAGKELDGVWYVERESFAAFRDNPAAPDGPAPCRSACSRASHCGTCDH
jgi:hypothetical protein